MVSLLAQNFIGHCHLASPLQPGRMEWTLAGGTSSFDFVVFSALLQIIGGSFQKERRRTRNSYARAIDLDFNEVQSFRPSPSQSDVGTILFIGLSEGSRYNGDIAKRGLCGCGSCGVSSRYARALVCIAQFASACRSLVQQPNCSPNRHGNQLFS
jgi:hypothetical protein